MGRYEKILRDRLEAARRVVAGRDPGDCFGEWVRIEMLEWALLEFTRACQDLESNNSDSEC